MVSVAFQLEMAMDTVFVPVGQPVPASGNFIVEDTEGPLCGVEHWPHWRGDYLARYRASDWRESGLKRFKSRAGAIRFIVRRCLGKV